MPYLLPSFPCCISGQRIFERTNCKCIVRRIESLSQFCIFQIMLLVFESIQELIKYKGVTLANGDYRARISVVQWREAYVNEVFLRRPRITSTILPLMISITSFCLEELFHVFVGSLINFVVKYFFVKPF